MPPYEHNSESYSKAINDFHEARRKAKLENLLSRFRGQSTDLLSYDEVRQKFRLIESARRTLEMIPLNKIVGSVNRYTDFTRSFLPLKESDEQRWAKVRMGFDGMLGLPPIEAYKVGDVYFVSDGHHRVSVTRELGAKSIEGYVTPVATRVPLSPGDSPDDIILKAEYDEFLFKTRLDDLKPGANLMVTAPGQYPKLLEHIEVNRYFMGQKQGHEIPYNEAVADWYDTVYLPFTEMVRERNLLRDFPGRTETDLYLWIMDYRQELSGGGLGWEVGAERAANAFAARFSPVASRKLPRVASRILDFLTPEPLVSGPPAGSWRAEHQSPSRGNYIFDDILVTVPGGKKGWVAVRLAIEVARREDARLTGLHVITEEDQKNQAQIPAIEEEFSRLCAEAGITGRLVVEAGQAAALLCQRSPWVDLIAFHLNYPPPTQTIRRLRSGVHSLIRRCSSPILAVPDAAFHLDSALLAYGSGRKSEEALFLATYLAGRWKIPLCVVTAQREEKPKGVSAYSPAPLERARLYLELHDVEATYIEVPGDPARAILLAAEEHAANFLIMGGYESHPLRESLFGSTVDRVLRSTRRPTLICR